MRRIPRFLVIALPVIAVLALWAGHARVRSNPAPRPTIEPTLPIGLELRQLPADSHAGLPPRLEARVDASVDLRDVSLSLVLAQGLVGEEWVIPASPLTILHPGDRRVYVVPIRSKRTGEFPVRLRASFRLQDGRVLHTEQGILWKAGLAAAEGRHNAGAYEWMGVPVDEPQP